MSTFFVIEGVAGSGKTTHIEHLKSLYPDAVFTREPGGTTFGEQARTLLFDHAKDIDPISQLYLVHAGRWQNIIEHIAPALAAGKTVFCDRFQLSTYAFQVASNNRYDLLPHLLETQAQFLEAGVNPHYIFLDAKPEDTLERLKGREGNDYFDDLGLEFHTMIYQGYQEGIAELGLPCTIIDATKPLEEVQQDVVKTVKELIQQNQ